MTKNEEVLRASLAAFADPARRDQYFDLYSPSVILHGYAGVEPGIESVKEFYRNAMWSAFPDAAVDLDQVLESGDHLTARFTLRGTHRGTFLGIPGSGRPIELSGITILRFESGKCVERWSVADFLGVLVQIGVFPPEG